MATARQQQTPFGLLNIVSPEGLIGLKLQAYVNNPQRTQDLADIRSLICANREALDMQEIREYFRLFDKDSLLRELAG